MPSVGTFVAGDSVYNHSHLYLSESGNAGLAAWYRALDLIEALEPRYAVAGHNDERRPGNSGAVQRTRTYLSTFQRLKAEDGSAAEVLFDEVTRRFPESANPKDLRRSLVVVIGG